MTVTSATGTDPRQSTKESEAQLESQPDKPALDQCDCTDRCGDDPRLKLGTARPCEFMKGWLSRPQIESIEANGSIVTIKLTKPVDNWAISCLKRALD